MTIEAFIKLLQEARERGHREVAVVVEGPGPSRWDPMLKPGANLIEIHPGTPRW